MSVVRPSPQSLTFFCLPFFVPNIIAQYRPASSINMSFFGCRTSLLFFFLQQTPMDMCFFFSDGFLLSVYIFFFLRWVWHFLRCLWPIPTVTLPSVYFHPSVSQFPCNGRRALPTQYLATFVWHKADQHLNAFGNSGPPWGYHTLSTQFPRNYQLMFGEYFSPPFDNKVICRHQFWNRGVTMDPHGPLVIVELA